MSAFRAGVCLGTASIMSLALSVANAEVIFEENFDDQPDFTASMHGYDNYRIATEGFTLPEGWTHLHAASKWNPEDGYPDKHSSLEILASHSDKARGGVGKSAVHWRESWTPDSGWAFWNSDSQLVKVFNDDFKELYVEFYIRFSDNWYQRIRPDDTSSYTSKLFRVGHFNRGHNVVSGSKSEIGPIFMWHYKRDNYGIRNIHVFRGGAPGTGNYYFDGNYTRSNSYSYSGRHVEGEEVGGTDPMHRDKVNGGPLIEFDGAGSPDGYTTHEHVFGQSNEWTKVAFYVKMNSAPGVSDGIVRQWIDGHRVQNTTDIPWVMDDGGKPIGWNYFAIGGNDYFQGRSNSEEFEDWYAIDDLVVRTDVPVDLGGSFPPKPPSNISID